MKDLYLLLTNGILSKKGGKFKRILFFLNIFKAIRE